MHTNSRDSFSNAQRAEELPLETTATTPRTVAAPLVGRPSVIELCAGAGGQALGVHRAGFEHVALVEINPHACATLRYNGQALGWTDLVHQVDVRDWRPAIAPGQLTLLAGGIPCPPFSIAGKQLGADDERNLFPAVIELVKLLRPRALQIENVRGLMSRRFDDLRHDIDAELIGLGYVPRWKVLNASDFGVPQLRPRTLLIALRPEDATGFAWPQPLPEPARTVGEVLLASMSDLGWDGAQNWAARADRIAPTIVGGSTKHGGPDLGPTRARKAWADLGVDGRSVGDAVPGPDFRGVPRLTVEQVALLQGFPSSWKFLGTKTAAYRQVGNAFPPPVADAVARQIAIVLGKPILASDAMKH